MALIIDMRIPQRVIQREVAVHQVDDIPHWSSIDPGPKRVRLSDKINVAIRGDELVENVWAIDLWTSNRKVAITANVSKASFLKRGPDSIAFKCAHCAETTQCSRVVHSLPRLQY